VAGLFVGQRLGARLDVGKVEQLHGAKVGNFRMLAMVVGIDPNTCAPRRWPTAWAPGALVVPPDAPCACSLRCAGLRALRFALYRVSRRV
jgi:hypothetical protein